MRRTERPDLDLSELSNLLPLLPYQQVLATVVGFDGQPLAAFSAHRRMGRGISVATRWQC